MTARALTAGPVVVEVRDVAKAFAVPVRQADTLRGRLARPLAIGGARRLQALGGVSFDVHKGEFFGIVGRNGSGKSTLLKILAGIYRPDGGRVRMAGRLAPFIELGVGFNPELTARENVALNGVLMGLGRRDAAARLDAVLDFAELVEHIDLKLKNYSSGMLVRLAFAVMVEADADIMLIDEVLAVGDAAFAQKCLDVFHERRAAGRTVLLVTHDMATVQGFCDRALLIHDGEQRYLGDPDEAAQRYLHLNFGGAAAVAGIAAEPAVELVDAWIGDAREAGPATVDHGRPIALTVIVRARRALQAPAFAFQVSGADGGVVFGFDKRMGAAEPVPGDAPVVGAGRQVRIVATLENALIAGEYAVGCSVTGAEGPGGPATRLPALLVFTVRPRAAGRSIDDIGMVSVSQHLDASVE